MLQKERGHLSVLLKHLCIAGIGHYALSFLIFFYILIFLIYIYFDIRWDRALCIIIFDIRSCVLAYYIDVIIPSSGN